MKQFTLLKTPFLIQVFLVSIIFFSNPVFAFMDLKGKEIKIEKQLGDGKWSIVELWVSDCGACRQHMPSMVQLDGKLKNTRILGISLDGQKGIVNAKAFIKEFDIKFKNFISNPIEVNIWMEKIASESLIGTPTFMIFNPKGKLVAAQPGIVLSASLERFIKENSK